MGGMAYTQASHNVERFFARLLERSRKKSERGFAACFTMREKLLEDFELLAVKTMLTRKAATFNARFKFRDLRQWHIVEIFTLILIF